MTHHKAITAQMKDALKALKLWDKKVGIGEHAIPCAMRAMEWVLIGSYLGL